MIPCPTDAKISNNDAVLVFRTLNFSLISLAIGPLIIIARVLLAVQQSTKKTIDAIPSSAPFADLILDDIDNLGTAKIRLRSLFAAVGLES